MVSAKLLLTVGLALALSVGSTPAFAQRHGDGGGHSRGTAVRGGSARGFGGGPRAASPRAVSPSRSFGSPPREVAPRGYAAGAPRAYSSVRSGAVVRGAYAYPAYRYVAPARFYRPYYTFRPRLSIGFGLWVGYPVAYAASYYDPWYSPYGTAYPYPYVYPYSYPYGYPAPAYPPASYPLPAAPVPSYGPRGTVGVQPADDSTGGLSFEITPASAEVTVDGTVVGTVGQFTSTSQPLGLPTGRHRIEIRAVGYRTTSFDVDILAGQVIPYQGSLER